MSFNQYQEIHVKREISFSKRLNELFFVSIICLPLINDLFASLFHASFGISKFLIGSFLVYAIFSNNRRVLFMPVLIASIVILGFLVSFLKYDINPINFDYFINFLYYGGIPLVYINSDYDSRKIIRGIAFVGIIGTLYYQFIGYDVLDFSENMRRSNLLLPSGIAILNQLFFDKKNKVFEKLFFFIFLVQYVLLIFSWGTRGSVLAIFMYPVIVFLSDNSKLKRVIVLFILISVIVFTILNIEYVLINLKTVSSYFGLKTHWIDRTILLLQMENLSNSRYDLWGKALDSLMGYPLLGRGISGFELEHGTYTHNIFFQFLVDFGIILGTIFIVLLVFLSLKSITLRNDPDRKSYIIMLMSSSLTVLMFTSVIWYFTTFWIFLYECIKTKNNDKFYHYKIY